MSPKSIDVLINEIEHVKNGLDEFKEDTTARFDKFERLLSEHMVREEAQSKADAVDMKNLIAGLDGKYAPRWVATVVAAFMSAVFLGVVWSAVTVVVGK